jgi:hypothetical protein
MLRHIAQIAGATLLIIVCLFLPYLPGRYDRFAIVLATMAQLLAAAGLVLVPLGLVWLAYEMLRRRAAEPIRPPTDFGFSLGLAAVALSTLLAVVMAGAAATEVGLSLGIAVLALWVFVAYRLVAKLRTATTAVPRPINPAPLYLILLPLAAAIGWFTLLGAAAHNSRNRAIDASTTLINDIEQFRATRGHYPLSLQSVWEDYEPGMIGVERYHYEPSGAAYNLYFEHPSPVWGTKEFVMYNKLDEQDFSSHNVDLLQLPPDQIALQRGYYSVRDTARPHWKYFCFD